MIRSDVQYPSEICEVLGVVRNQQYADSERSIIELYVDMELIHRNVIPNAIEKFEAFSEVQKLKAARRIDKFFAENPDLDKHPSRATVHREYIKNNATQIDARTKELWGDGRKPEHWSGQNLIDRAKPLGKEIS